MKAAVEVQERCAASEVCQRTVAALKACTPAGEGGPARPAPADLAAQWVMAWNQHDVDGLLALYADSARLDSPLAARLDPGHGPCLEGKEALRAHFEKVFGMGGGRIEMVDVLSAGSLFAIYYHGVACLRILEVMRLDNHGRITDGHVLLNRPI